MRQNTHNIQLKMTFFKLDLTKLLKIFHFSVSQAQNFHITRAANDGFTGTQQLPPPNRGSKTTLPAFVKKHHSLFLPAGDRGGQKMMFVEVISKNIDLYRCVSANELQPAFFICFGGES